MELCAELSIDWKDFLSSTPRMFNSMLRGKYQKMQREAQWAMTAGNFKKPVKLKDYLGFELLSKKQADKLAEAELLPKEEVVKETRESFESLLNEFGIEK